MGGGLSLCWICLRQRCKRVQFRISKPNTTRPNIIVLLFDALSARHLSLYDYRRKTSPNLERFAQRAIVYNNHYAPGHLTTPSTASFFTGAYPWTHRALYLKSQVRHKIAPFNIFNFLSPDYYQAAFTQNMNADILLYQLGQAMDVHRRVDSFSVAGKTIYPYLNDSEAIDVLYAYDLLHLRGKETAGSLFLAPLRALSTQIDYKLKKQKYFRRILRSRSLILRVQILVSACQICCTRMFTIRSTSCSRFEKLVR